MMLHDLTTFGGLLANLRERRGWHQGQLSVAACCDRTHINRLESGARTPSREIVADLAEALELDADDTGRLYVAAGLLPPGNWTWVGGWCIRPASDMPSKEETTNAV
jgi:transcriptional regulator with XRE-family HTH domain